MKHWKKISISFLVLFICCIAVYYYRPQKYPGFTRINNVLWKKLHSFGNDTTALGNFDVVEFNYLLKTESGDSLSGGGGTDNIDAIKLSCSKLPVNACSFCDEFLSLHNGDSISYWLDISTEDCRLIHILYNHDTIPPGIINLTTRITGTYSKQEFLNFLVEQCRWGQMDETDAIFKSEVANLFEGGTFERHGKISLRKLERVRGDSIRPGDNISIAYTTHLLNGTRVDSLTEMQFEFGKPGQLVGGLQFGLTKMCEGERALIYMPSELAFGVGGSSTGIIPPRTPVYFDVQVTEVKKNP